MGQLEREAIADLVLENAALRQQLALYEQLLGAGSELLYEPLACRRTSGASR